MRLLQPRPPDKMLCKFNDWKPQMLTIDFWQISHLSTLLPVEKQEICHNFLSFQITQTPLAYLQILLTMCSVTRNAKRCQVKMTFQLKGKSFKCAICFASLWCFTLCIKLLFLTMSLQSLRFPTKPWVENTTSKNILQNALNNTFAIFKTDCCAASKGKWYT